MPDTKITIYDKKLLTQLKDEQLKAPQMFTLGEDANKEAIAIEQRSADFLADFANGVVIITDDAREVMPEYLEILKRSSHPQITAYLERAENKFKTVVISQKKKQEKKYDIDKSDLSANQFAILQNKKKVEQLTSADLLTIHELLEKEKGYNTTNLKAKLQSFVHNRIRKVLKGELKADEGFDRLVEKMGSLQQRSVHKRQNEPVPQPVVTELTPAPQPKPVQEQIVEPKPAPVITEPRPKDKRSAILEYKQEERLKFLSANNFSILQNKKKMAELSSEDYLLMEMALSKSLKETKKNTRAYNVLLKQRASLSTFAQSKIEKTLKGELKADKDFNKLVSKLGTYQQNETYRTRGCLEPKPVEVVVEPIVKKPEASSVKKEEKPVKNEEKPVKNEDEPKKVKAAVVPWYKKVWQKTKRAAIIVGVAAVSLFGLAKVAQSLSSGDKADNAPKTEQKVKDVRAPITEQQNVQDNKTITFDEARVQNEQTAEQKALDAKYNIRVQSFKESQDALGINLNNLDNVINNSIQNGQIELSETLTLSRAKYMVSFYAQYPASEAGKACQALLNGEETNFNKDDFNKWDKELGVDGSTFAKTINAKGKFSPIDHASEQTKKDYQKVNQDFMKILSQNNSQTH